MIDMISVANSINYYFYYEFLVKGGIIYVITFSSFIYLLFSRMLFHLLWSTVDSSRCNKEQYSGSVEHSLVVKILWYNWIDRKVFIVYRFYYAMEHTQI